MHNKILFACRPGPSSALIAQTLSKAGLLDSIIIESGSKAKKRKLNRIKNNTKWWQWPIVFIDLGCLFVYQKLQANSIRNFVHNEIGVIEFPSNVVIHYVDDINDPKCLEVLKREQPCTVVVLGTSILKKNTITICQNAIYNIHGGIVPKYRNVHSEFWAYIKHDYQNIGITIMHLDSGIDTGDIAAQARLKIDECFSIFNIKVRNLKMSSQLIVDVLMSENCEKTRVRQDKTQQSFYHTPKAIQLFALFFLSISRKILCIAKRISRRP